jgi:hypothetical protein
MIDLMIDSASGSKSKPSAIPGPHWAGQQGVLRKLQGAKD